MMDKKSRNMVLTVLFLGVLVGALDIAIVGPALPAIGKAFGIDERGLAWVFNIYVLFSLSGSPIMAKLSDRFGRRPIYMLDIALFGVGSLVVALSPTFEVMLLGRAMQGLSAGGIFPIASAVIGDTFPEEKQGSALGLIGAVFGLAFIVGPILSGILLLWSWHWLFLINIPIVLLVIRLGWNILPATRRTQKPPPFDFAGMVALIVALGGLTLFISQLDAGNLVNSLVSLQVWPFLLLTVLAIPLFLWLERRAADPIIHPRLLATRQLILANTLTAGAGLGEATLVFLPALAVAAFKVSESVASLLLFPVVLAMAFSSPLVGRLLDRWGSKRVVIFGTATFTVGVFLLGLLGNQMWAYITSGVIIGLGLGGLLGAPLRYIMLKEAPLEFRAAAQGMITASAGVGQLIGGAMVGAVAASQGGGANGYTLAYLCVGFVSLVLVFLALGLKSRYEEKKGLNTLAERDPALAR